MNFTTTTNRDARAALFDALYALYVAMAVRKSGAITFASRASFGGDLNAIAAAVGGVSQEEPIQAIKALRTITGLGLKESKDIVDDCRLAYAPRPFDRREWQHVEAIGRTIPGYEPF